MAKSRPLEPAMFPADQSSGCSLGSADVYYDSPGPIPTPSPAQRFIQNFKVASELRRLDNPVIQILYWELSA